MWRDRCGAASCEQGAAQGLAVGEAERYGSPASQPAGLARQEERAEQLTLQSGGERHIQALSAQSYGRQSRRGPCSRARRGNPGFRFQGAGAAGQWENAKAALWDSSLGCPPWEWESQEGEDSGPALGEGVV